MKRPAIEYFLIGIGATSGSLSLITATLDLNSFVFSILISILVFAPFFVPWHRTKHPYLYLPSLIIPAYAVFVELNKLIHLYQALSAGKPLFEGLSFLFSLAFLNMHLLIPGILILTIYAVSQTLKSRATPLTQVL